MAALLEAKNVTKIYAKSQRPSLNKVSFSVTDGEIIALPDQERPHCLMFCLRLIHPQAAALQ